jgi:hypothetical protein
MSTAQAQATEQRRLNRGDTAMSTWHETLRTVTFGAALVLMLLSLVSLHWALVLIGIPDPLGYVGAFILEIGMASTASAATTVRQASDSKRRGMSLWAIFIFGTLLSQAANVGHAIVSVSDTYTKHPDRIPTIVPDRAVYVFAAVFAAMFPLGGTAFVHVSGWLRKHGVGADWIDPDAKVVDVEAGQPIATSEETGDLPAATGRSRRSRRPAADRSPASTADRSPASTADRSDSAIADHPITRSAPTATDRPTDRSEADGDRPVATIADRPAVNRVVADRPIDGESAAARSAPDWERAYEAYRAARLETPPRMLTGTDLAAIAGSSESRARAIAREKFAPRFEQEQSATDGPAAIDASDRSATEVVDDHVLITT